LKVAISFFNSILGGPREVTVNLLKHIPDVEVEKDLKESLAIDTSKLSAGVYYFEISVDGKVVALERSVRTK